MIQQSNQLVLSTEQLQHIGYNSDMKGKQERQSNKRREQRSPKWHQCSDKNCERNSINNAEICRKGSSRYRPNTEKRGGNENAPPPKPSGPHKTEICIHRTRNLLLATISTTLFWPMSCFTNFLPMPSNLYSQKARIRRYISPCATSGRTVPRYKHCHGPRRKALCASCVASCYRRSINGSHRLGSTISDSVISLKGVSMMRGALESS